MSGHDDVLAPNQDGNGKWLRVRLAIRRAWQPVEAIYKMHVLVTALYAVGSLILAVPLALAVIRYDSIRIEPTTLTNVFLITYAIVGVLALHFGLRARRYRENLREKSRQYDDVGRSLEPLRQQLQAMELTIAKFAAFESSFDTYSYYNAQNEKKLFDCLWHGLGTGNVPPSGDRPSVRESLIEADRILHYNIQHLATCAADLLGKMVGKRCATSVKLIDNLGTVREDLSDAMIKTLVRDGGSQPSRGTHEVVYRLSENTGIERVLIFKDRWYAAEGLRDLSLAGNYRNARAGWQVDYNATIVVPIGSLEETSHQTQIVGVFCADYMGADVVNGRLSEPNFNTLACHHLLIGMSYRLSILLHRLDRIKSALDQLASPVRDAKSG